MPAVEPRFAWLKLSDAHPADLPEGFAATLVSSGLFHPSDGDVAGVTAAIRPGCTELFVSFLPGRSPPPPPAGDGSTRPLAERVLASLFASSSPAGRLLRAQGRAELADGSGGVAALEHGRPASDPPSAPARRLPHLNLVAIHTGAATEVCLLSPPSAPGDALNPPPLRLRCRIHTGQWVAMAPSPSQSDGGWIFPALPGVEGLALFDEQPAEGSDGAPPPAAAPRPVVLCRDAALAAALNAAAAAASVAAAAAAAAFPSSAAASAAAAPTRSRRDAVEAGAHALGAALAPVSPAGVASRAAAFALALGWSGPPLDAALARLCAHAGDAHALNGGGGGGGGGGAGVGALAGGGSSRLPRSAYFGVHRSSLLHAACAAGRPGGVAALASAGGAGGAFGRAWDAEVSRGLTPLHLAARRPDGAAAAATLLGCDGCGAGVGPRDARLALGGDALAAWFCALDSPPPPAVSHAASEPAREAAEAVQAGGESAAAVLGAPSPPSAGGAPASAPSLSSLASFSSTGSTFCAHPAPHAPHAPRAATHDACAPRTPSDTARATGSAALLDLDASLVPRFAAAFKAATAALEAAEGEGWLLPPLRAERACALLFASHASATPVLHADAAAIVRARAAEGARRDALRCGVCGGCGFCGAAGEGGGGGGASSRHCDVCACAVAPASVALFTGAIHAAQQRAPAAPPRRQPSTAAAAASAFMAAASAAAKDDVAEEEDEAEEEDADGRSLSSCDPPFEFPPQPWAERLGYTPEFWAFCEAQAARYAPGVAADCACRVAYFLAILCLGPIITPRAATAASHAAAASSCDVAVSWRESWALHFKLTPALQGLAVAVVILFLAITKQPRVRRLYLRHNGTIVGLKWASFYILSVQQTELRSRSALIAAAAAAASSASPLPSSLFNATLVGERGGASAALRSSLLLLPCSRGLAHVASTCVAANRPIRALPLVACLLVRAALFAPTLGPSAAWPHFASCGALLPPTWALNALATAGGVALILRAERRDFWAWSGAPPHAVPSNSAAAAAFAADLADMTREAAADAAAWARARVASRRAAFSLAAAALVALLAACLAAAMRGVV